jgi:hypothetical protein
LIRFVVALLITTAVLTGGVMLAVYEAWIAKHPSFFFQTQIFLVFSTVVIYAYLYKVNKPDFFVQLYLLTMTVKLLAYGVYVYFMISEDPTGAFENVVFFMGVYITFTVLEITFLYQKISSDHTAEDTPKKN